LDETSVLAAYAVPLLCDLFIFSEKNRIDDAGIPNNAEYFSINSTEGDFAPLSISDI
jgi:hypothetical protein